jgi:hypothetical protein
MFDEVRRAMAKLARPRESGQDVEGTLEEKTRGGSDVRFKYYLHGRLVWSFGISRGSRRRSKRFYYVPNQMWLRKAELEDLARCPLSKEGYNALLSERGAVS